MQKEATTEPESLSQCHIIRSSHLCILLDIIPGLGHVTAPIAPNWLNSTKATTWWFKKIMNLKHLLQLCSKDKRRGKHLMYHCDADVIPLSWYAHDIWNSEELCCRILPWKFTQSPRTNLKPHWWEVRWTLHSPKQWRSCLQTTETSVLRGACLQKLRTFYKACISSQYRFAAASSTSL